MAVSFVNFTQQSSSGSATASINKPTGVVADDYLILFYAGDWSTPASATAPDGSWTLRSDNGGSNQPHKKIWTKIAGGSEPSSYTWNLPSADDSTLIMVAMRGADTTVAPVLTVSAVAVDTDATRDCPSLSGITDEANGALICAAMVDPNSTAATFTKPTAMTECGDVQASTFTAMSAAYLLAPSDPTGVQTFTCSTSSLFTGNGGSLYATSIYLAPASTTPRTTTAITPLTGTNWVTGTTPVSATYPGSLAEGDIIYLLCSSKPGGTAPSTPTDWDLVGSTQVGSGSVAAGTGPTRVTVFRRVAGSTPPSGSQAVALTGADVMSVCMQAYRATGPNLVWSESWSTASSASDSTPTYTATFANGLLAPLDALGWIVSVTDDSGTDISHVSIAATSCTFTGTARTPNDYEETATGNDLASAAWTSTVVTGPNTGNLVINSNITAAETSGIGVWRIRATVDVVPVTRYVDNSVGASGNGQGWATAWKNFSNIVWSELTPGSTLYISGGSTTKTYSEILVPAASGLDGFPITITRGVDSGHTGVPIISGGNARANCYDNGGYVGTARSYITISGLRLENATENPVWIRSTTGCVIDGCEAIAPDNATYSQAIFANQNTDFTVRNSTVTTVGSTTGQADGIYLQDNLGTTLIEDNSVTISNTDNTGHSDTIQCHQNGRTIIRRNTLIGSTGGNDNHVMWLHAFTSATTSEVYSNVLVSRGGQYNLTYWRELAGSGHGTLLIYNNTIYGGARALNFERVTNVEVKNNIVISDTAGTAVYSSLNDLTTTAVTHNIVRAPSGTVATTVASGNRTYAQWTAAGFNASGSNSDPLLTSPPTDLTLQAGSPAIDTGTTLALVEDDIDGLARPQGSSYDIGAYEATAGISGALAGSTPTMTSALAGTCTATGALAGSAPAQTSALAGTCRSTGALAGSVTAPTSALAGTCQATGALAGSATGPTSAITGTVSQTGALAGSTPTLSSSLVAGVSQSGALASTAPEATSALVATTSSPGPLAATAPQATSALAGTSTATGALAGTAPVQTSALEGDVSQTGALAGTVIAPSAELAGTNVTGVLSGTAPVTTAELAAEASLSGALAGSAPQAVTALAGTVSQTGALAGSTPTLSGAITGTSSLTGELASSTPTLAGDLASTVSQTGALAATAPSATAALATAEVVAEGELSAATPAVTAEIIETSVQAALAGQAPATTAEIVAETSAPGPLAVSTPQLASAITGEVGQTGELAASAPSPTMGLGADTVLGDAHVLLPTTTGSFTGESSADGALAGSTPAALAELLGTASSSGALAVAVPATLGGIVSDSTVGGALASSTPAVEVASTGGVSQTGAIDSATPTVLSGLVGDVSQAGGIAATVPAVLGAIVSDSTIGGELAATAPATSASMTSIGRLDGALSGGAPAPSAELAGLAHAVGALAGEAPATAVALDGTASQTGELTVTTPAPAAGITSGEIVIEGELSGSAPATVAALPGLAHAPGDLTGTVPAPSSSLTAETGSPGVLAGTAPFVISDMSGDAVVVAVLAASLPAPALLISTAPPPPPRVITAVPDGRILRTDDDHTLTVLHTQRVIRVRGAPGSTILQI